MISQPVYGGINAAVRTILSKLDIEVTWLEEASMESYRKAVKENTKVLSTYILHTKSECTIRTHACEPGHEKSCSEVTGNSFYNDEAIN